MPRCPLAIHQRGLLRGMAFAIAQPASTMPCFNVRPESRYECGISRHSDESLVILTMCEWTVRNATGAPIWSVFTHFGCVGQHFSLHFSVGGGPWCRDATWPSALVRVHGWRRGWRFHSQMVAKRRLAVIEPPKMDQYFKADGKRKRVDVFTLRDRRLDPFRAMMDSKRRKSSRCASECNTTSV
ncbi:hypothetical protein EJ03DRAFT_66589 [Teratosphaeria nubilosa]|uniref:Uncharacterized protein n=1 Tax=Teratosphaeria nubilosa TaxID=161662 RepID=A0A6G1LBV6_9PEZI|nr:hypothetical protein EJ03DRAFT_66589 [Teratosphaeria nubilosa]